MPTSAPSSTVHPWTTARCPIDTRAPTTTGKSGSEWRTQPSCTLLPSPTSIGVPSARITAPNQTLDVAAQA